MRKPFWLIMLTEGCRFMEETRLKREKLEKKRAQSLGVDWDEEHNWGLYWEEMEPRKVKGRFIFY
jgi:hypothetical protein